MAHWKRTIWTDKLSAWVKEQEADQAPGSETGLLGEYRSAPLHRHIAVSTETAAWWVGAYAAQGLVNSMGSTAGQADVATDLARLLWRDPDQDEQDAAVAGYNDYLRALDG